MPPEPPSQRCVNSPALGFSSIRLGQAYQVMGAERIVGTAENRKYHRASVLWPATLLCRNNSFECVIFNISANGAKLMIKNLLDDKARVTLSSMRCGALDGDVVLRNRGSLAIRFLLTT